jgi:hypothetical protein
MNVEDISEYAWTAVIDGTKPIQFEFLGLQLLITNLRQRLRTKEITMSIATGELKKFLIKYHNLPAAQKDLNKIAR